MTFSIPDDVAERLAREVPEAEQSEFLVRLLKGGLPQRRYSDEELAAAADALNADNEIAQLERDWDGLSADGLDEHEWKESASR